MNRALVDTDILSYYLRGNEIVVSHFKVYLEYHASIEISIITYYEIMGGLLAKRAFNQLRIFEDFVSDNVLVPITESSIKVSAKLYAKLRREGKSVDDIDLLIAGIAIDNSLDMVTNNEQHFNRIPNLNVVNWNK